MERQHFGIVINAPREKVWDILWNQATYPEWTAVFSPGSRAETTWQKGSKVLFMDAGNEGMVATVAENRPHEFMSLKHLGMVKNGVEDLDSAQTKQWAGAMENYTLKTVNGETELAVEMDVTQEHKDFFVETWPKALEKVKQLAEQSRVGKHA
jgi:uncharacterized protein YndB with AHSA1/START domain